MKIYEIRLTRQAYQNLMDIRDYIQNELLAPEAAKKIVNELEGAMKSLATMPARIRLIEEEKWRRKGIRRMVTGNFYIYFLIDEDSEVVKVLAAVAAKRNQEAFLSDLEQ